MRELFIFKKFLTHIAATVVLSFAAITSTVWASVPVEMSSQTNFSQDKEETVPADTYLRLFSMRCEDCALIMRDLIEMGAVDNTIGAVKRVLDDSNYAFRVALVETCSNCYQAVHFWEMYTLKRPAQNDEINHWLQSDESRILAELFSK